MSFASSLVRASLAMKGVTKKSRCILKMDVEVVCKSSFDAQSLPYLSEGKGAAMIKR